MGSLHVETTEIVLLIINPVRNLSGKKLKKSGLKINTRTQIIPELKKFGKTTSMAKRGFSKR